MQKLLNDRFLVCGVVLLRSLLFFFFPSYKFNVEINLFSEFYFIFTSLLVLTCSREMMFLIMGFDCISIVERNLFLMTGNGYNENFFFHLNYDSLSFLGPAFLYKRYIIINFVVIAFIFVLVLFVKKRMPVRKTTRLSFLGVALTLFIFGPTRPIWSYALEQINDREIQKINAEVYSSKKLNEIITPTSYDRNILFIFGESLEYTFFNEDLYPGLMKEMNPLLRKGLLFNNIKETFGTSWTVGGIFAHLCSLPISFFDSFGKESANWVLQTSGTGFINCLPDFLKESGFTNKFFMGGSARFGGFSKFISEHSFESLYSLKSISKEIVFNDKNVSPFGYRDSILFEYTVSKFKKDIRKNKKLAYYISTINSHFPGYTEEDICTPYQQKLNLKTPSDLLDSLKCADKLIASFIKQMLEIDPRLLIVFVPDHLMHVNKGAMPKENQRSRFISILNSGRSPKIMNTKGSSFDLAKTLIDIIGGEYSPRMSENLFQTESPFFDSNKREIAKIVNDIKSEGFTEEKRLNCEELKVSYNRLNESVIINGETISYGHINSRTNVINSGWRFENLLEINVVENKYRLSFIKRNRLNKKNSRNTIAYIGKEHESGLFSLFSLDGQSCTLNKELTTKNCLVLKGFCQN